MPNLGTSRLTHRTNRAGSTKTCAWIRCLSLVTAAVLLLLLPQRPALATQSNASAQLADTVDRARTYLRNNPISPPDTASPRATLESFLYIMNEANSLWRDARQDYEQGASLLPGETVHKQLFLVEALLEKAAQAFDLGGIPETSRNRASIEIVLQFQEILDRIPLPDLATVPGQRAGTFATPHASDSLPDTWTIPGTSLSLVRQTAGERIGHYLVSQASVERIPRDYAVVRQLPIMSDRGEDLFEYYIYTPGNLIAPKWYNAIKAGPDWLHIHLADQAYWQWLALALLALAYLAAAGGYLRWRRWQAVSVNERRRVVGALLTPLALIGAAASFRYLCEDQINITGTPLVTIGTVTTAIIWSATAWLVYQVLQTLYVWFVQSPNADLRALDASLLRTGFRVFSLAVALAVLGYGATKIGIPIYGVIAGLGVGGLAIALAAQPTIENLIGGVILYADRMVRVGEFCEFDDLSGTVEAIGIRSTRIRALDRTLITVANADLAKRKIINYSKRDQFHFRHKLGLRYETSAEVLRTITTNITAYLQDHDKVLADPLRVRLVGFDDYSVTIDVYAYVQASNMNDFLEIQEQMLFDIRRMIAVAGSDFAFPSSTLYLGRDAGLADTRFQTAYERELDADRTAA